MKAPLAIRCPDVGGAAQRLLGSVIEVVAEGWADLRFELQSGNQLAVMHHQDAPGRNLSEEHVNPVAPLGIRDFLILAVLLHLQE